MGLSSSQSSASYAVKVLIADDSAFMRASLSRMVESDEALCVVGTAETGLEAIAKIGTLHPDVVTLDLDMPGLSGLETLKRVMSESPLPVIIVSSMAREGAEATLQALELGAFDCIAKQLSYASEDVLKVQDELVGKIKAAAGPLLLAVRAAKRPPRAPLTPAPAAAVTVPAIIAIGTSTGGPKALQQILSALPANLPVSIVVVQHMPVGFIGPLAKRLDDLCMLQVREAADGDPLTPGHVYLAPAGKHLTVYRRPSSQAALRLSPLPNKGLHIPSVDVMMSSVADTFGRAAMGIILTGMGDDGALGMQAIFHQGGLTLGQDQATCVVYGMPRSCAELGVLTKVVPLRDIPARILTALRFRKPQ